MSPEIIALFSAVAALAVAAILWVKVLGAPVEHARAAEIADAIAKGANAFLRRQYMTVGVVGLILLGPLAFWLGAKYAIGFVMGAVASAFAGIMGMKISVGANVRVAEKARSGFKSAFTLAFQGGSVTGLMVVGAGLLCLAVLTLVYEGDDLSHALVGLAFGGSLISVFARLGGGIFTKGADVGADLVGKVEANIPEDDPRNPAVIADNVGDNVGDCAGMAADLFETYTVTAAAVMLIASLLFPGDQQALTYALMVGAVGALSSVVGIFTVRVGEAKDGEAPNIMFAMYVGLIIATVVELALLYILSEKVLPPTLTTGGLEITRNALVGCAAIGGIVTAAMMIITDIYTGSKSRFVDQIAKDSEGGHGTNVISGLAVGMNSTLVPVLVIVGAMIICHKLGGLFGIGVAAMSMLSLAGIIVAIDAYGPITDNAGGIAEMAEMGAAVRSVTDPLDAVGNTTKAVTKGYAIASAALAAVVLFATFMEDLRHLGIEASFDLSNTLVVAGLFIGGMIPFVFASFAMSAVGRAGKQVVVEVRRQFKEIPGLMQGTAKPDYGTCVDIVTKSALREMILPALIPAVVPLVVGLTLGAEALGGVLIGSIVSGVCVALSMTTGGAAWDNAKKLIETGAYGGKGSDAHKAAVTGDTVGDPYKDTAGPAINPMLKLINIVALLIITFLA